MPAVSLNNKHFTVSFFSTHFPTISTKFSPNFPLHSQVASICLNSLLLACQVPAVSLNNERFMVPELIFRPSDIAMDQAGLAGIIIEAANAVHPDLRPLLFSNVICSGGTSQLPGFSQRLLSELRPLVPDHYEVFFFCFF